MIYTDGVHMVTDGDIKELHEFAESIGLKRHFFHGVRKGHPHYDLTNAKIRRKAMMAGAKLVSSRDIVKIVRG